MVVRLVVTVSRRTRSRQPVFELAQLDPEGRGLAEEEVRALQLGDLGVQAVEDGVLGGVELQLERRTGGRLRQGREGPSETEALDVPK